MEDRTTGTGRAEMIRRRRARDALQRRRNEERDARERESTLTTALNQRRQRLTSALSRGVRTVLDRRLYANPSLHFLKGEGNKMNLLNYLRKFAGQRVRVRYVMTLSGMMVVNAITGGDVIFLDTMVDIPTVVDMKYTNIFATTYLIDYNDGDPIIIPEQDEYKGYLSITAPQQGGIDFGAQVFQHGYTNCVLRHLQDWIDSFPDGNRNKKANLKKIKNLWKLYADGVPEDCLQPIADMLNIAIRIKSPYSKTVLFDVKKESTRPRCHFNFINTRDNHVELEREIDQITVLPEEMKVLFEMKSEGALWRETKDKEVYYLRDGTNEYFLNEKETKETVDFKMRFQGFDIFKHPELHEFIKCSMLNMGCVDNAARGENLKHIDQKNSYATFKEYEFYTGFPAFITDNIQVCDKIMGEGFYYVSKFNGLGELAAIDKMLGGLFINNNIYPAPVLRMLTRYGGEYEITHGCWGTTLDFDFPAEMIQDKTYQRFSGILECGSQHKIARVAGVDFNWLSGVEKLANRYGKIYEVLIPKSKVMYRGHISSYLKAFSFCQTITQLKNMDISKVVRVCVDGIYTNEQEIKLSGNFRIKNEIKLGNTSNQVYLPSFQIGVREEARFAWTSESSKFQERESAAIGPGGAGKTTYLKKDDVGAVDAVFTSPSHELRVTTSDNGVTHAKLLSNKKVENGRFAWEEIGKKCTQFNHDEASMLTLKQRNKIIARFPYHKHIFAGDLGYQCPPFSIAEDDAELTAADFQHVVKFTKDYRSHDKETRSYKKHMREMMDEGYGVKDMLEALYKNTSVKRPQTYKQWRNRQLGSLKFPKLNDDVEGIIMGYVGEDFGYTAEDMIIAFTHKICNEYTSYFEPASKKYKIIKNTKKFQNGNVVYTKPQSLSETSYELRHGFTIHSAQGKTLKRRLFIDVRKINCPRLLYTAISRVHKLSQIVLLNGI